MIHYLESIDITYRNNYREPKTTSANRANAKPFVDDDVVLVALREFLAFRTMVAMPINLW